LTQRWIVNDDQNNRTVVNYAVEATRCRTVIKKLIPFSKDALQTPERSRSTWRAAEQE
jgi:hypothetical protein